MYRVSSIYFFHLFSFWILTFNFVNNILGTSENQLSASLVRSSVEKLISLKNIKNKVIVKRSVSNGLELNKTFSARSPLIGNNYRCIITFRVIPPNSQYINQLFYIIDDITGLNVQVANYQISNPTTNTIPIENPSSNLNISFRYTGSEQLMAQYDFTTGAITIKVTKSVSVFSGNQILQLSESSCIQPSGFNAYVAANPPIIAYILLGLLIAFIILIILIIIYKRCYSSNNNQIDRPICNESFEHQFLLVDQSHVRVSNDGYLDNEKSFINVLVEKHPRISGHKMHQLDVEATMKADAKFRDDFQEFHKLLYQIWLNNISSKYPLLKQKIEGIKKSVIYNHEEVFKKHQLILDSDIKKLITESVSINKMNLDYLLVKQDEERRIIRQRTDSRDSNQVEDSMAKCFEKQRHDLIIQLKIKEDLELEKVKATHEQNMKNEINNLYMSGVGEIIAVDSTNLNEKHSETVSSEDASGILKNYFEWQQALQLLKENEKIRQTARLESLFQTRKDLANRKKIQVNNSDEVLAKQCENFVSAIQNLEDVEEIDRMTSQSMLGEFEKHKSNLLVEMEKNKENQINDLQNRLKEAKRKNLDKLALEHEREMSNLLNSHKTDDNMALVFEELENLEREYCENIISEESGNDIEGSKEVLKIYSENSTQTAQKMNDKISKLTMELEKEGVNAREILNGFERKTERLKALQESERAKQLEIMKEKQQKYMEQIDKNADKELKERKKQYESENNIADEIVNIQKSLSNNDRLNVLKEYNTHKLIVEDSITNAYLEQRKKMEEAVAINKKKKLKKMEERHHENIEGLFDKKVRNRNRKSDQQIKDECHASLMVDYMNNKLEIFSHSEWKNDLEKEIEEIRREMLAERATLLNKKEEQAVALILQIQMLKAKETVELKEQEDKLLNIQLAALESNSDITSCQDIVKSYKSAKDKLQEEINKAKVLQERSFKRKLENKKQRSLLDTNPEQHKKQSEQEIFREKQNFGDQTWKNKIESERSIQNVEKEFLKQFLASSNCSREDIFNLMMEIYPVKSNQEIEILVEEIYPKSKPKVQQALPRSGASLLKSYRKYSEKNKKNETAPGSVPPENINEKHNLALDEVDSFPSSKEPENYYLYKHSDNNNPSKVRKKKKKVRQKQTKEKENFSDEF